MPKHGKQYAEKLGLIDRTKRFTFEDALKLVRESSFAKFDGTVECAVNLGIDPKAGEQRVRGTIVLPHGTGKVPRVAVFARGEAAKAAADAGADTVGAEDLVDQIKGGWSDFDILVATPDMMKIVGQLGRMLGPRMPNKKAGTVTPDPATAIAELKAGRLEFKNDRGGTVHAVIGKLSFSDEQLAENFKALINALQRAKPATAKGRYIKGIAMCSTMSPSVKLDVSEFN